MKPPGKYFERNQLIYQLRKSGVSVKQLAERFGLNRKYVHLIIAREKAQIKKVMDK